ncbi:ribonuclease E inhibitor RraB [Leisingera sp. ANG-Vp]|uniref:ribonuclease E inhibitor RraB n=1 Tax=Leisingera sp. ANG-Vp TaxID=1577896 RepID=UPI00057D9E0A|nr:ribonuclease E inhibitor RraB [Leisingera sp. ANG-Vp]KIC20892.1 hypothetical protein RA20_06385 [Leisingera sp. ANG-Vp]
MTRILALLSFLLLVSPLQASEPIMRYLALRDGWVSWIYVHVPEQGDLNLEAMDGLMAISISRKEPTANGLPAQADAPMLQAFSDTVSAALKEFGGIYLGEQSGGNVTSIYAAIPLPNDGLRDALLKNVRALGHEPDLRAKLGGHEEFYASFLLPTLYDYEVQYNLAVTQALAKQGDLAEVARDVEHFAYFKNAEGAAAFENLIKSYGYIHSKTSKAEAGPGEHLVRFRHFGVIDVWEISERTLKLKQAALEAGGEYDGWETQVIKTRNGG